MDASRRATGVALAAAAAALFISGCANQGGAHSSGGGAVTANVKCFGANGCKGQSECKTEMSACKGHNECKGQGFMMMSERACVEKLLGRS